MRNYFLLLSLAGLTGCQTESTPLNSAPPPLNPPPAAVNAPSAPATPAAADKRIFTDPTLKVAFHSVNASTTESSAFFFKIQIDAQNLTDSPKSFNYHIDWLDKNGNVIELPEMSLPMSLMGGQKSSIVAVAPTPLAKDYRIRFFPAQ